MAAGLADADRLRLWRAEPERLEELGIDPSVVDLGSIEDFVGLSEKIRHNLCRDDLRMTFRLLSLSGLEIEFFRDYAPRSLERRRRGLKSINDRLDGLMRFAEGWASGSEPVRRIVRDVLRHEHAVAILRTAQIEIDVLPTADTSEPSGARIPLHNGPVLVHSMSCDPRQVGRVLNAREPDLAAIKLGSWTFGYHKAADGQLRMLEMDQGVGDLLLAVDDRSSVDSIAERLLGDRTATGLLLPALYQLAELGILVWRPDGRCHATDAS